MKLTKIEQRAALSALSFALAGEVEEVFASEDEILAAQSAHQKLALAVGPTDRSRGPVMSILETARRAKELAEKATPGPWEVYGSEVATDEKPGGSRGNEWFARLVGVWNPEAEFHADASFIAFSRFALPELAEAVEELVAGLSELTGPCAYYADNCAAHKDEEDDWCGYCFAQRLLARITEGDGA